MKTAKLQRLFGLLLLAGILLTGCSKDNSMEEIIPSKDKEQTPDELVTALESIDGVYNVQAKTSPVLNETVYYFNFRQLIDHNDPNAGYFDQQVAINFKGFDKDVVLYTHGYSMFDIDTYGPCELTNLLGANQVNVEHRYFGNSQPELQGTMSFTYFNAEQQALDLHNIVQTLKKHVFQTNKWASTGVSKDGIASALYAYYSDKYGWNDIDLFLPFCAPFLPGSINNGQYSCHDLSTGIYLEQVCGEGYPEGSVEAIACQRLHDIPKYICNNREMRNICNRHIMTTNSDYYSKVVDQYYQQSPMSTGDLEKDLTALTCFFYYAYLFNKFSYVQFPQWAELVPDPAKAATDNDEMNNLLTFITMDHIALKDKLATMEVERAENRSATTDYYQNYWNYIKDLRNEKNTPSEVQSFMELGTSGDTYQRVDGTYLTDQQVRNVNFQFSIQNKFQNILKQDQGKLMLNFRQWVATESTQNIVFVYAYNDPWTGGQPDKDAVSRNPKVKMLIDPIAVHNDFFLDADFYTAETKNAIIDAVNKCMK